ncbi:vascular cell adhesion protein 1 [Symphorus nematophorus]
MQPLRMLSLLTVMLLLCAGADSQCPTELNPLSLDPPEVIEEYETPISINCTTAEEFFDMMSLTAGNDSTSTLDERNIATSTSLSDWNLKAVCTIKLNDTLECSKDLKITIYKNPKEVNLFPKNNLTSAVEGAAYELQCDVLNVAPVQNLVVMWYKGNHNIKNDTFNQTTHKTPEDVSSTLKVSGLDRREDGAQFRCEAQLDFGPQGPQPPPTSARLDVSVHYAPGLKNNKDMEFITVSEGRDATLSCEAEGNPPPVFSWTSGGVDISEKTVNLTITGTNSTTYTCTAANYLGSKTKNIHVRVLAPVRPAIPTTIPPAVATTEVVSFASVPRDCPLTLTPAEVVVRFGDEVSVDCNATSTDTVGMGWEATSGGIGFTSTKTLTWKLENLTEWSIEPLCYTTLTDNHQCQKSPKITLYKTPDTVSISASHSEMMEGNKDVLICSITNVAPVRNLEVKWYRGNETVHTDKFTNTTVTPVSVSSTLRITPERDHNGMHFQCKAELQLGPKGPDVVPTEISPPYTAVVLYKPLTPACSGPHTGKEQEFSLDMLSCHADGNPPPTLQWYYQGGLIDASVKLSRNHSGTYTVKAENKLGKSSASVDITIEYGPSFTCKDRYEVRENGDPQTVCEPAGMPKPNITWYKDGKSMGTPQGWKRTDSGEYILQASNRHGKAEHKLTLDVLYAPVFMQENHTKEVAQGENVTFECNADGNPAPKINWYFNPAVNVMQTNGGRQSNISITRATSTNAGVYNCVATNKVGSVTRSATLVMKDKSSGFPSWLFWGLLILAIFVILLVSIIMYHRRWQKHGQYSFVPAKVEDIPMEKK